VRRLSIAFLLLLPLAGCGGSSSSPATTAAAPGTLDTARVARAIEASILGQRHLAATVTCPVVVRQARGANFVCQARTKHGTTTPFAVVQTDDAGHVTYSAASTP